MENSEPLALYDVEEEESNLACRKQAMEVHCVLGTHKLDELRSGKAAHVTTKRDWLVTQCQE